MIMSTPDEWTISHRVQVNGRWLTPGVEVTVNRIKGRLVFLRHVTTPCGNEWLDFMSGKGTRSAKIDEVATVHRARKERQP